MLPDNTHYEHHSRRLSICYAAPGHALLSTSGGARNILSVAKALSRWADVTVAFRSIRETVMADNFKVIAFEQENQSDRERKDDVAISGFNVLAHLSYLKKLTEFSRRCASSYDVVLEKGWRLSGFLSSSMYSRGVPSVLVENDVRCWSEPIETAANLARYGAHKAAQYVSGFYSRRVPWVIAETDELKAMLAAERGVRPERIKVVGLGVDHNLFCPLDQASCRVVLGIRPRAFVLLYVGGMDAYHDVGTVIDALAQISEPFLELHVVGDGEFRVMYEAKARRARVPIRFHGQVPNHRVPEFIAAADLCLAPYRVSAFPNDAVSFSTLKIPEYMACGRPVVSVPSGHIKKLIEDHVSGFLFSNEVSSWAAFFQRLPSREKLKEMGRAAREATEAISWGKTARCYLDLCQELAERRSPEITNKADH